MSLNREKIPIWLTPEIGFPVSVMQTSCQMPKTSYVSDFMGLSNRAVLLGSSSQKMFGQFRQMVVETCRLKRSLSAWLDESHRFMAANVGLS
jgi:hypothetical protein